MTTAGWRRRVGASALLGVLLLAVLGPLQGVATALVGPIRLPASQTEAAEPAEQPAEPAEGDDTAQTDEAGVQNHGCGEGEGAALLASCAGEVAADCAAQAAPTCTAPLVQAVSETVLETASEPPVGEPDPPCQQGEPAQQLACAVQQVRDQCPEDGTCAPVDPVLACLAQDEEACETPDVVAGAAAAICTALGEGASSGDDSCEQQLSSCEEPADDDCGRALDYLAGLARDRVCAQDQEGVTCVVADVVVALVACRDGASLPCAFQVVWDGATPTICGLVGDDQCASILDTCDDPTVEDDCEDAADYLATRGRDQACGLNDAPCAAQQAVTECSAGVSEACEGALYGVLAAVCAAGLPDCPPEPVPSLRECTQWDSGPVPRDDCVAEAVVAAICATQTDCPLEHEAVIALMGVAPACSDPPAGDPCHQSLQDLAVAALCANPAACFPAWAEETDKCQGTDDLACHALALLHQVCGAQTCPEPVKAFEPCVKGAAELKCGSEDFLTFLQDWIVAQCGSSAVSSTACPVQADIRATRALFTPPSADPVPPLPSVMEPNLPQLQNGSPSFPFQTISEALRVLRQSARQPQHARLTGPLHLHSGVYAEGLTFGPDDPESLDLRIVTPGEDLPVIQPVTGPALTLDRGHRFWIQDPVRVGAAIRGPVTTGDLSVSERAYVGDWVDLSVTYANSIVAIPELTRILLKVDAGPGLVLQRADGTIVPVPSSGVVELIRPEPATPPGAADGLFDGAETLRVSSPESVSATFTLDVVGVSTDYVYRTASATLEIVVPQRAPVPPPGVPRTLEDDVPPAVRLSGEDRAATAAAVSREAFPEGADDVFVATGQSYADALAAGPAAARSHSPVVLVERDRVPEATRQELQRLGARRLRLMGGTAAIGAEVERELAAGGAEVSRLRGEDRYATAAAVSAAHYSPGVPVVYVASGEGFADALSGGAAAAAAGGPVLLVQRDAVPVATNQELQRLRPARVVVLGGRQAISETVETQLRAQGSEVRRVSGPTRYATSAAVSRDAFSATPTVYVATGETFPDALAGVPAAGADRAPLMLVEPDRLPAEVAAELDRLRPRRIVILGGERSVTQRLERELRSYQTRD